MTMENYPALSNRTGTPYEPWQLEQGDETWTDPATGYTCALRRHPRFLHWSGYVGLPKGHAWHEKSPNISIHGGLSYMAHALPYEPLSDLWWLGFSCAAPGDWVPRLPCAQGEIYRRRHFAYEQTELLARRLRDALPPPFLELKSAKEQIAHARELADEFAEIAASGGVKPEEIWWQMVCAAYDHIVDVSIAEIYERVTDD